MIQEIKFETLPPLKEGERRIMYVDVKEMPKHTIQEFLDNIVRTFREKNLEDIIILPMENGIKTIEFGVYDGKTNI